MCFAACHWADIAFVVYGAGIADAARLGFRELTIPNTEMKHRGGSSMGIRGGFLRDECLALFREWQEQNPRQETY
jgi:tRNA(Arg) A34 adenosine deaminase TadA